jgi:hypothetical protein
METQQNVEAAVDEKARFTSASPGVPWLCLDIPCRLVHSLCC